MTEEFNNLLEEDLAGRSLSVGQIVEGTVVQINEDGVFVDIGAKSEGHLELDQIFKDELAKLNIGHQLRVRIIKKVDGEYRLSKKSVDFEEAWNKLLEAKEADGEVGIRIDEKVKNGYLCTAYGVLQGFIHHTNFHGKPNMGDTYNATILEANRKARKLVFTRRDVMKKERDEALERDYSILQEGMVVEGVVDKLSPYGAFIKITDNLTGLLHISEFSFEHVKKPSEVLKAGELVQVKILTIDRDKNKISLSRKATMKDPLMLMLPGEEIDGKVESLADFGIFVKLDNGVTGLVHISELSFKKFSHPSDLYKPNDGIRVKVLKVQPEERRVSLSAKACERDPWAEVHSRYSIGQEVAGPIMQVLQSGAVMKLDEFFEAFVPIGEIVEERIEHPGDVLKEGDEKSGVILSIDSGKRRIRVSLVRTAESVAQDKAAKQQVKIVDQDTSDQGAKAGKVTLGDILGGKLDLTGVGKKEAEAPVPKAEPVETPAEPVEEEPDSEMESLVEPETEDSPVEEQEEDAPEDSAEPEEEAPAEDAAAEEEQPEEAEGEDEAVSKSEA